ncbi:MAG: hypothetical protein V4480_03880 [Patescibacteria group bacterium]
MTKQSYIIAAIVIIIVLVLGLYVFGSAHSVSAPVQDMATTTTDMQPATTTMTTATVHTTTTTTTTTTTPATTTTPVRASAGEHCGGNMATAKQCVAGFHCAPEPGSHLPFGDVGGICIAN